MKHPGDGYYFVICDVCGRRLRARDAVKINDKYNSLNGMVVCKHDADKTNLQNKPIKMTEKPFRGKFVRPEDTNPTYIYIETAAEIESGDTTTPSNLTNPGVPRYLSIYEVTSTAITFQWQGPENSGSSAIKGWKIERESPIGGGFTTLVADTGNTATFYENTGLTASTQYNYRVSAINLAGTGSASVAINATTATS